MGFNDSQVKENIKIKIKSDLKKGPDKKLEQKTVFSGSFLIKLLGLEESHSWSSAGVR